jgi:hypothetical protein
MLCIVGPTTWLLGNIPREGDTAVDSGNTADRMKGAARGEGA